MSGNPVRFKKYRQRLKEKLGKDNFELKYKQYDKKNRIKTKGMYFKYKAIKTNTRFKHNDDISTKELTNALFWLWHKQRGRCALTGIKLLGDETTHLDHIIPKSRGGSNHPSNLQFVCAVVNQAKNGLTHEEFVQLCRNVVNHSTKP